MVLLVGFEPTTYHVPSDCSANWNYNSILVGMVGLEPTRISPTASKTVAAAITPHPQLLRATNRVSFYQLT